MNKFLIISFLICFINIKAQVISGSVIDANTKKPVEGASVYFDNTTIGTTTNQDGFFKLRYNASIQTPLIISFLGYKKQTVSNYNPNQKLQIEMLEAINTLDEVVLNAKDPFSKKDKLKIFEKYFLGTTKNAKSCKIMNEEVIDLRFLSMDSTLVATAKEPIIIRNRKLQYDITYDLQTFTLKSKVVTMHGKPKLFPMTFHYEGSTFFEDRKASVSKRVLEKRETTYRGSILHFMRALLSDRFNESGFYVRYNDEIVKPIQFISVYDTENPNIKKVRIFKSVVIIYHNSEHATFYSEVIPNQTYFYINSYGNYFPIRALTFRGKMGENRMGDALPLDYKPLNK